MDDSNKSSDTWIKSHLKALLLHLASKSDDPSGELHEILTEVLNELHSEVREALKKQRHLKLIPAEDSGNLN